MRMNSNNYPSKERLRKFCEYKDGILIWKQRTVDDFMSNKKYASRLCKMWNQKYAGKIIGHANIYGYLTCRFDGKTVLVSRLIYIYHYGNIDGIEIDHINRNKKDNRIENLRKSNRPHNTKNCNLKNNNRSGVCGVYFSQRSKKWIAYITKNYHKKEIGYFKNKDDAVMARYQAEIDFGFVDINPKSTAYHYLDRRGLL